MSDFSSNILPYISLSVGGWAVMNGILHDVFILRSKLGKKYDRELLRLLMDGHILMTCGLIQMISFLGLRQNEPWAYYIAGVASMSLFTYCLLIFPFLKSFATMFLNLFLVAMLLFHFFN